jgi:hypothetical protein
MDFIISLIMLIIMNISICQSYKEYQIKRNSSLNVFFDLIYRKYLEGL